MVDISIVIVSYNTKDSTLRCVESVLSTSKSLRKEIIVVDNNSRDGSQKVLRDFWRKHKNLVLVENNENLGFSKAVNIGIKKATGDYILLLNSDTEVKNDSIGKLLTFAKGKKDAGVVGSRLVEENGDIQASCYNFPTVSRAIKEYIFKIKGSYEKYYPKGKSPVIVDSVVGAVFLITPNALKNAGLLDERYFMYLEDIDYCRQVYDVGLKVYYYPNSQVIHTHGASGKSYKKQYKRLVESSKIYHGLLRYYLISLIIKVGQKI